MTDPKLGWLAWEADQSGGYAQISYNYRIGFGKREMKFANAYTGGYDLLVAACTPTYWMVEPYRLTGTVRDNLVLHTMFEAEPLPPGWVENMNAIGCIWTPSDYCVDLFRRSGVTRPILKTGYGVSAKDYEFVDRHGRDGQMRFGIWADTLVGRKNVTKAVKAFMDAALPDASLDIKLHSFAGMSPETMFCDSQGRPLADVAIHTGSWPRTKLVKWLQSLDCMIYLSGGEGFGLMPLEAAVTGLTTIAHNCTGMQEYLNGEAYYLVESDGVEKAVSYAIGYGYPCEMPRPNHEQAVELIRYAYKHREETYDKGAIAAEQARRWTWEEECAKAQYGLQRYFHLMQNGWKYTEEDAKLFHMDG